jgi:hypothetical protein
MTAYIKGATLLSPQRTFSEKGFPSETLSYADVNFLKCIEPGYSEFIDPMASRRMSRIVKMGVCTALKCLRDTGTHLPDAIITGTGLGCIEDTEKFLGSLYANEEKLLNPTPFIQSTHNTVAGAIALAIKCNNYNTTYAHRGFSFETALQDALLQLAEEPAMKILTGSFDEITPGSWEITKRLGLWKNHPVSNTDLLKYGNRGSLAGEGVAFFLLGGEKESNDIAALKAVKTFYKPDNGEDLDNHIREFLRQSGPKPGDIDLVLYGFNGDSRFDGWYRQLMLDLFKDNPAAWFKHLCGEYDTAASFALWTASMILKDQQVHGDLLFGRRRPAGIRHILIYNQLLGTDHALFLLERC